MKFSTSLMFSRSFSRGLVLCGTLLVPAMFFSPQHATGQATNTSGSVQGTITDSSGAVVPSAKVTIKNQGTAQEKVLTADGAGFYTSGPLNPGTYQISVSAPGFSSVQANVTVQISSIATNNYKLAVGTAAQVVQVEGSAVQVNSEQSNVGSVITPQQIANLPVQGRNFLDLAQLEPGVQLQSGESFDPTKAGYSALSIGGVSGRTTRILLDGSDITDETVGTTIFNVPSGAIGEFELNRSTGDVSGDITSSGSVFVATPSGTNNFHGQGFYIFQDHSVAFANSGGGVNPPFQRNQFGGYAGGPIIKDKLFIFGDLERIKQDSDQAVTLSSTFAGIQAANPSYGSPFRDTYSVLRLDYDGPKGIHFFARGNYEVNSAAATYGYGYSRYANRDNTPGLSVGADFTTGRFTHSFRGGYEKFHNLITDASGAGIYNPIPSIELHVPSSGLYAGPNLLAPQQTYQSEKQLRYDGSWTRGAHTLRYGGSLNRILGGGFASFFGLAPEVVTLPTSATPGDPTSYLVNYAILGNGQGYSTEIPTFGKPSGGQGDWRLGFYVADTWKLTPNFTLNAGVRYQRDTGRSDSDLAPIPCSAIDTTVFPNPPCSGSTPLLDQFGPGLGDRVRQPNNQLGPQLGFAYAVPATNGKTVLSAGVGLYYENFVFNNVLFDRPAKLAKGLFFGDSLVSCSSPAPVAVNGVTVAGADAGTIATLCSEPVSVSGPGFAKISKAYQAAVAAAGPAANSSFVGETLSVSQNSGLGLYAPHTFTAPRSIHVNFGIQQQLGAGMVLSADYVHQVDWKFMQSQDINAVGDARYFDPVGAAAGIQATLAACGVGSVDEAIISCPGLHGPGPGNGANIADFSSGGGSGAGIGSGIDVTGGSPAGGIAAFPGKNGKVGQGMFQFPNGRSSYDALQVQFKEQRNHPIPGFSTTNLEVSYNYSRFVTTAAGTAGSDQYFTATSWNWRNPTQYVGRGSLDRPQQLSFGGYATVKKGPQVGLIAHFSSAPPSNLVLDNLSGTGGQLFQTDLDGSGNTNSSYSPGQLAPGTNPGSYMRDYHGKSLNNYINFFNSHYAGTLTPAGQVLVNNGVLTQAQLTALGGVVQPLAPAPAKALENGMLKEIDANIQYSIKIPFLGDSANLIPAVAFYNVANFANYGGRPSGLLLNTADAGTTGFVNGPSTFADRGQFRTERGSGTFNLGGPRTAEFQLKLNF